MKKYTPEFPCYRGRIAPTPTGFLHRGHARTFRTAWERARAAGGMLIFRMEDLDGARCSPVYVQAALDDLRAIGLSWEEGPDVGGPCAPYCQSQRRDSYMAAWQRLKDEGFIYPSHHSRRDVAAAAQAPHAEDEEAIFPLAWRPCVSASAQYPTPAGAHWRFRVPDGEAICFNDRIQGPQRFVAGEDFGDFVVWRNDDIPAYELAVVVDDALMGITEVVRGADLLKSTARQILLYRALGWDCPAFCHCPLVVGEDGQRLAKRAGAESIRAFLARGEIC